MLVTARPAGETPVSAGAQPEFHISAFPAGITHKENPYFTLCHAALARRGISVSDDLQIDRRWLNSRRGALHAIHLHWPERFWRQGRFANWSRLRRAGAACDRLLQLSRFIRAARRLGMQSIWTVHNIEPHEGAYRWDYYGYRLLGRQCDLVICHSQSGVRAVRDAYQPRGRVLVMPHGDPAPAYPPARPRVDVLRELRLDPQRPVVACLGRLRRYKGLELACAAFERLNGRVQLIIGGPRHDGFDVSSILATITRTPGAVLIDKHLTDQEFADFTAASDAMLLPYDAITGSGALLAALGFGRGVVASELPYFEEILAPEPDAGVTVPDWNADAWANAIVRYLDRPAAVRTHAALRLAARYAWDRCVEPMVSALGVRDRAEKAAGVLLA